MSGFHLACPCWCRPLQLEGQTQAYVLWFSRSFWGFKVGRGLQFILIASTTTLIFRMSNPKNQ